MGWSIVPERLALSFTATTTKCNNDRLRKNTIFVRLKCRFFFLFSFPFRRRLLYYYGMILLLCRMLFVYECHILLLQLTGPRTERKRTRVRNVVGGSARSSWSSNVCSTVRRRRGPSDPPEPSWPQDCAGSGTGAVGYGSNNFLVYS